jgi:hypothetical protein
MMMLLIAASACGLGWVVHQAREQRLAVQAILAKGGVVEYDYQYDATRNRRLPNGEPWRPVWLQRALGDEYFHSVVCVGLDAERDQTDADLVHLKHLRGLTKLQYLDLASTQVTDGGLDDLRNLTGLERIDLPNNPQLTGSFLQHVADLPNLKDLVLRGSGITDSALSQLNRSQTLQSLMLDRTRVTDAGLAHLRGLISLRSLDLSQTAVTETGITQVREWFPQARVEPPAREK